MDTPASGSHPGPHAHDGWTFFLSFYRRKLVVVCLTGCVEVKWSFRWSCCWSLWNIPQAAADLQEWSRPRWWSGATEEHLCSLGDVWWHSKSYKPASRPTGDCQMCDGCHFWCCEGFQDTRMREDSKVCQRRKRSRCCRAQPQVWKLSSLWGQEILTSAGP